jgi:hypothetical protein
LGGPHFARVFRGGADAGVHHLSGAGYIPVRLAAAECAVREENRSNHQPEGSTYPGEIESYSVKDIVENLVGECPERRIGKRIECKVPRHEDEVHPDV